MLPGKLAAWEVRCAAQESQFKKDYAKIAAILRGKTMPSAKRRLFDVPISQRIPYADKPLNLGGEIRHISVAELEKLLRIKYDETIYVEESIQPLIQSVTDTSLSMKTAWYEGKEDVVELLQNPTMHLVICNLGKHGHGVSAATDLPQDKFISLYAGTLISRSSPKIPGEKVLAFQPELILRENYRHDTPLIYPNQRPTFGYGSRNGNGIGVIFQHLPRPMKSHSIESFQAMLHERDGVLHDINMLKLDNELYSTEFFDPDALQTLATQNIQPTALVHNGYPVIGMRAIRDIKKGELLGYADSFDDRINYFESQAFFTKDGAPISPLFYKITFGGIKFGDFKFSGELQPLIDQVMQIPKPSFVNVPDSKGLSRQVETDIVRKKLQQMHAIPKPVLLPQIINIVNGETTLRSIDNLDGHQAFYFYRLRIVLGDIILKKAFQPIYNIPIAWLQQVFEFAAKLDEPRKHIEPLLQALKITSTELQALFSKPEAAPKLSV
jgi:hypothetical protein